MKTYPNYRVSIEIILLHNNKILLTKRSPNAKVAPDVWNVPAGKVKYLEIPIEALYREAKEEINVNVKFIRELGVRAFKSISEDEEIYRLVYTYLVNIENEDISKIKLNDEHTEYRWIEKEEVNNSMFNTLSIPLKKMILSLNDCVEKE